MIFPMPNINRNNNNIKRYNKTQYGYRVGKSKTKVTVLFVAAWVVRGLWMMLTYSNSNNNQPATDSTSTTSFTATVATFLPRFIATTTMIPAMFCSAWTLRDKSVLRHRQGQRRTNFLFSVTDTSTSTPTASPVTPEPTKETYRQLYPPSNASSHGTIETQTPSRGANGENDSVVQHTLYYEIHGTGPLNALFLHGGPGAGCFPNHARFFDPSKYTVILLDQRGAGRSTPRGCIEDNTLELLVEDCELVRKTLVARRDGNGDNENDGSNDEQPWDCVLGGSWGATLGLAYAQRYPHVMRSLILRGICALRPPEIDWLLSSQGGSAQKLKEAWKNFSDAVNANENANGESSNGRDALHAHYDCLIGTRSTANGTADNALRMTAARSWMTWEMAATSSASQNSDNDNNNNTKTTTTNLVLVSSPENNHGKWRFETPQGEPPPVACDDDDTKESGRCSSSPETVAFQLRQNINTKKKNEGEESAKKGPPPTTSPRPVRPIDETMPLFLSAYGDSNSNNNESNNSNKTAGRFRLPPNYVPAQAMLTCFYSVNDRYAMGNNDLIQNAACSNSSNNSNNISPIRIIGIQGGLDPICPPDTAMDLLKAIQTSNENSNNNNNGNMELRIPLNSGHSMYDPGILHELIQATDRLADEFLKHE